MKEKLEEVSATPFGYLDYMGLLPAEDTVSKGQLQQLLSHDDFHIFYRCNPGSDQDVMLIGVNPRFQRLNSSTDCSGYDLSWYTHQEGRWLLETDGNPRELAAVGLKGLQSYFTRDSNHWNEVINAVRYSSPDLESNNGLPHSEYMNWRFFSDIYYTNAYKFGTNAASDISASDRDIAAETLKREIEMLDPSLVVVCGKIAWQITQTALTSQRVDIEPLNDHPVTEKMYAARGGSRRDQARNGAYQFGKYRVVVAGHPGRAGVKSNETKLRQSIAAAYNS